MDEERKNYKPQLNRFKEGNRKIKEKGRQKLLEMADEH